MLLTCLFHIYHVLKRPVINLTAWHGVKLLQQELVVPVDVRSLYLAKMMNKKKNINEDYRNGI